MVAVHCCLIMITKPSVISHYSLGDNAYYASHGATDLSHCNYVRLLTRLCTLWYGMVNVNLYSTIVTKSLMH